MTTEPQHRIGRLMMTAGSVLLLSAAVFAQTGPPIGGLTGTIALEGTVDQEYAAANTVAVKAIDGTRHVFHFAKNLVVHGGKSTTVDALKGLRARTTVVVHYQWHRRRGGDRGDRSRRERWSENDRGHRHQHQSWT